ncbi:hypothetical protein WJR50_31940 [Catalinimonas sp. 4WD22]|uniref:hypothetical protein n=1 Tax=Catalinimonas locisalis TaxID=3133978 RepID=UPI003100AFB2
MKTNIKYVQENALDKLMKYLGITMAVAYVVGGILMMTLVHEVLVISKVHAYALSAIFISFGIYRAFRIYRRYTKPEDED